MEDVFKVRSTSHLSRIKDPEGQRREVRNSPPSGHHDQPKIILPSKELLMYFAAATGRAKGPETVFTPDPMQPQPPGGWGGNHWVREQAKKLILGGGMAEIPENHGPQRG